MLKLLYGLVFFVISISTFALTRINDSAGIYILQDGVVIQTNVEKTSIEGVSSFSSYLYFGNSNIAYSSHIATIRFSNTSGKKLKLKKGAIFTLLNFENFNETCNDSGDSCWQRASSELNSDNPNAQVYSPIFWMSIKSGHVPRTVGDLRRALNYEIEFYYAPGEDGDIEI